MAFLMQVIVKCTCLFAVSLSWFVYLIWLLIQQLTLKSSSQTYEYLLSVEPQRLID